jgi:membrane associated rhomboid family serine protease
MYLCPNCKTTLNKAVSDAGCFWHCPACNGRAVTLPVLQKTAPQELIQHFWQDARMGKDVGSRPCPGCGRKMTVVPLASADSSLTLDVCLGCYFIWFDPDEFEHVPANGRASLNVRKEPTPVPPATLATVKSYRASEQQHVGSELTRGPDNWWEVIPAVFGLPVEYDKEGVGERPVITQSLSAIMALMFLMPVFHLSSVIAQWGLVPGEPFRHHGMTFVSSFLLHGGLFHLVSNLYFFLVFGDNVEEDLGRGKYVLLLAASALLGDVFHILADPRATIPLIGASGGISGVITYYALQFPKTRLGVLFFFKWFRIPAGVLMVLWLTAQVFGAVKQVSGGGHVSALAHLGGASIGLVFWLYARRQRSSVGGSS